MKRMLIVVFALLFSACGSSGPGSVAASNDGDAAQTYVIPAGTFDRIRAGENIEIIPRVVTIEVGQALRIENDDDEGGVVGPFYVGANETVTQRFTSSGTFLGECSVHPSGKIEIKVV